MRKNNLIFTLSGIRGISKTDLTSDVVKRIIIAFGQWYEGEDKSVIIGRDTRPSGELIEQAVIEGLISTGFKITNVGVCPTPILIHAKNKLKIPTGIIITGSHNPQQWNGLKLLSSSTFVDSINLEKIALKMEAIDLKVIPSNPPNSVQNVINFDPHPQYIQDLHSEINFSDVKTKNNLRVVLDTGAGTSKFIMPQILTELGCEVKNINNELLINSVFPREIEPIEENLEDLIMEVWQGRYDVGFAHDSDADRLAIIGENGEWYPEDVGLALITDYYLNNLNECEREIFFVTNIASSLMFEEIAEKYDARVIRTPIGERFLTDKMEKIIQAGKANSDKSITVFGGEGSCGGVMFPQFNKARDGILATAKIIELLVNTGEKLSSLVSKLPQYHSHRKKILIKNKKVEQIISRVKKELEDEGEEVNQVNLDLRFGQEKEWFILIHPSNTEPVIRVISEARRKSLARIYCEATSELVKLMIDPE
jgi:phosphomannomutase